MKIRILALILFVSGCNEKKAIKQSNFVLEEKIKYGQKQEIVISNERDTVIRLKSGSIWQVPAYTFADSIGESASGGVYLTIHEYTEFSNCLLDGLSTISDKGIIETDGMFFFSAKKNNINLKLVKPIQVQYKSNINRLGTPLLFRGYNKYNTVIWAEDSNGVQKIRHVLHRPASSSNGLDVFRNDYDVYSDGVYFFYIKNQKDTFDRILIDSVSKINKSQYYFFQLTFTGWINVDQYVETQKSNIIVVNVDENLTAPLYYIVCSNTTVLVRGVREGNYFIFNELPKLSDDSVLYLICFSYDSENTCTYAIKSLDINKQDNSFEQSEYRKKTLPQFENEIRIFLKDSIIPH